jgi:hypothetical protein
MSMQHVQGTSFEGLPPAEEWDRDVARRALDELFSLARQYRSSKGYHELIDFVARFRFHAPFNAMLVYIQMPGARFVAPPHRWRRDYLADQPRLCHEICRADRTDGAGAAHATEE